MLLKANIYRRKTMIKITLEDDEFVDLLLNRLGRFTDDKEALELYRQMYESLADIGEIEASVSEIVDNDWFNNCTILHKDDENFEEIKKLYDDGERDISCEDFGYSFVEAATDNAILVRY
jgi:hypothetical protein